MANHLQRSPQTRLWCQSKSNSARPRPVLKSRMWSQSYASWSPPRCGQWPWGQPWTWPQSLVPQTTRDRGFHRPISHKKAHKKWGLVCQRHLWRAGASNDIPSYLWDVITCLCPWNLPLAHKSSTVNNTVHKSDFTNAPNRAEAQRSRSCGQKYSNYSNEYDLKGDIYRASTNHNFMIA